jgi:uncharacterized membrane protein YkoI
MKNRARTMLITLAAVVGVGLGGYGVAAAAGGDEASDSDTPITGPDLDKAMAAALEHTGGGEVTETEIGDDGAAYGVEVRLPDGSQVEVNLDSDFGVIGANQDND